MTDFKTKEKWTLEAMKLMIVKYVLQIILVTRNDVYASKAKFVTMISIQHETKHHGHQ